MSNENNNLQNQAKSTFNLLVIRSSALIFLCLFNILSLNAQCPVAIMPDTVCLGNPFNITNVQPQTGDFYWDFCPGDMDSAPQGINLGNIGGHLNASHQINMVEDGGNHYGFIANLSTNTIVRYDFGSNPANTPIAIPLNPLTTLSGPTGIQVIKEGSNWYALVSNYFSAGITRLSFGNSITNLNPTETSLGTLNTANPIHLKGMKHQGNWYFLVANLGSNSVASLVFNTTINSIPISTSINSGFFNAPFGIDFVYDCNFDKYIAYVVNLNNAIPVVLDFGNNPSNIPTSTALSGIPLSTPTAVDLIKNKQDWHAVFTDQSNKLTQINLGGSLLNPSPQVIFNGSIGSLDIPRGIEFINHESRWYGMVSNWGGSFSRITYSAPCSATPFTSNDHEPTGVVYNTPGYHTFQLAYTDTNYRTTYLLDSVFIAAPIVDFSFSSSTCENTFSFLDNSVSTDPITGWNWDFGDGTTSSLQNPTHSFSYAGTLNVTLTITTGGCDFSTTKAVVNSKPTVNFSVMDGCVVPPLLFNNLTLDPLNTISNWDWDFGDGNTSTSITPAHTYINAGTYIVTLIGSTATCSDTISLPVTFNFSPDVNFEVSGTCLGQIQNFTNLSTIVSGTITSYIWDFGDGNNSSDVNPMHTYADTGSYIVSLTAVASSGCISQNSQVISINNAPAVDFSANPINGCLGQIIQFTDQTILSSGSLVSWFWDFGNGDTSTIQNPIYTYPVSGSFTVSLVVKLSPDCMGSLTKSINVNGLPQASFTSSTVQEGSPTAFTDQSLAPSFPIGSTITQWSWNFGDGNTSIGQNPSHIYATQGTYVANLTVTSNTGCTSSFTANVVVLPFVPVYYIIPDTVCSGKPFNIAATQPDSSSYNWDFCPDDLSQTPTGVNIGNPNTALNAAHQISIAYDSGLFYGFIANFGSNEIIRYDFGNDPANIPAVTILNLPGVFSGPAGIQVFKEGNEWFALVSNYFTSKLTMLSFGTTLSNTTPSDTDLGNLGTSSPIQIKGLRHQSNWYFFVANLSGNVSAITFPNSITTTPTFSILSSGSFASPFGIDIAYDSDTDNYIAFVASLNTPIVTAIDFGNSPSNVPAYSTISGLLLNAPTSIEILKEKQNWYLVLVDQGNKLTHLNMGSSLLNSTPQVLFNDTLGGMDTPRGLEFINHNSSWYGMVVNWGGSFSKIMFPSNCLNNPPASNFHSPSGIILNGSGFQNIMLSKTDSNLVTTYFNDSIYVIAAPIVDFNFNSSSCDKLFSFTDLSISPDDSITAWFWDFGDGFTSTDKNPVHSFSFAGNISVKLKITTAFGCTYEIQKIVVNNKPSASFTVIDGCVVPPLLFNNTTLDPLNFVTSWNWQFGDGNSSTLASPNHFYQNPGNYQVQLIANTSTCSDTISQMISYAPKPSMDFKVSNSCKGDTTEFINLTTVFNGTILSNFWDFGDGFTSVDSNPTHIFPDTGSYQVTLISTSNNGCQDTITKLITITLAATANFTTSTPVLCQGNFMQFIDQSTVIGGQINSWYWDFGTGDTSSLQNPQYAFPVSGSINVILTVNSGSDCKSSDIKNVLINPAPIPDFQAASVCVGQPVNFIDNSLAPTNPPGTMITQWQWDFGDGMQSSVTNPSHLYASSGTYPVTLTITTDLGCNSSINKNIEVFSKPVAGFTFGTSCSGAATQFTDTSIIQNGNITTWLWDFGDPASGNQNVSSAQNPNHIYTTQGFYQVTLVVWSDKGCEDVFQYNIAVNKSPSANFSATSACNGEYVQFSYIPLTFPSNASKWQWNFGDASSSSQVNPAHLYLGYGNYNVILTTTDSLTGCSNSQSRSVSVFPRPNAFISDLKPCIGQPFTFRDSSQIVSGSIVGYTWEISGHGIYNQKNPVITFNTAGNVTVKLKVTSDNGCVDSTTKVLQVSELPISQFKFSPLFGAPPLTVSLTNQSQGAVSYKWYFGDGNLSVQTNPTHVYQDTGKFTISLVATNSSGCKDSSTRLIYVIQPLLDIAVIQSRVAISGNYMEVTADVINLGTRVVTGFEILSHIPNSNQIKEKWTGSLLSGEIVTYVFNAAFEIDTENIPDFVCVTAQLPNEEPDHRPENNKSCRDILSGQTVFNLYPNPAKDHVNAQIILPSKEEIYITLYDLSGKKIKDVYPGVLQKGFNEYRIDLSDMSIGTYNCVFRYKGELSNEKLIIR